MIKLYRFSDTNEWAVSKSDKVMFGDKDMVMATLLLYGVPASDVMKACSDVDNGCNNIAYFDLFGQYTYCKLVKQNYEPRYFN